MNKKTKKTKKQLIPSDLDEISIVSTVVAALTG